MSILPGCWLNFCDSNFFPISLQKTPLSNFWFFFRFNGILVCWFRVSIWWRKSYHRIHTFFCDRLVIPSILGYLFSSKHTRQLGTIWNRPQFYIQLVYKPHFETWMAKNRGSSNSNSQDCWSCLAKPINLSKRLSDVWFFGENVKLILLSNFAMIWYGSFPCSKHIG